jgi:CheY-like chemotaxis protein
MKPISILVADDEESIRVLLQHWLKARGHTVALVGTGREAVEAMKKTQYDLVITDVLMPDGDGLDLITQLRQVQPRTRILAISGGGRYVEGVDCLKMAKGFGAHAVAMKPFTSAQLQAGIDEALAPIAERPA